MAKKLFVRRITRKVREEGYIDETEQTVQQLCFGRETSHIVVEEEIIPEHVIISLGAFGDMGGSDWKSKFQPWIPVAQGGTMEHSR